MKLYHGTNVEFEYVDLEKCPVHRDFGRGFYLTNIYKHAQERAQDKVEGEGGKATVMEFDFDIDEISAANSDLRIKHFETTNEEWAHFVMYNRMRTDNEPEHEYDIVEGAVADDRMFRQFYRYKNKKLELVRFIKSLEYREKTHQIAFCTERSLELLLDYNAAPNTKIEALVSELSVALMQERGLSNIEAMNVIYNSDTFAEFSDIGNGLYRKKWQEIYEMLKQDI